VEACAVELQAAIAGIAPRAATIPMYSTVSGRVVEDGELTETYWARNLREPVLFAPAVAAALAAGCRAFVEVSAHPVLTAMVADCAAAAGTDVQALASLRRAQPGRPAMLASLGALYAMGCDVAWDGVFPAGGRFVPLPTYPWQRRRFWFDRQAPAVQRRRGAGLPGRRLATAIPTFECSADRDLLPYAADHRIGGEPMLAAAAYAELARTAAAEVLGAGHHRVEDLVIHE